MSDDLIFEDLNRDTFDHKNQSEYQKNFKKGLSEEVVRAIAADKKEPEWMLEFRLRSLKKFNEMPMPTWGPDLSALDLESITYFAKSDAKANSKSWDDVPDDIKNTFERLGIPEAERKVLAGVGAQYESEVVYHSLKKEWEDKGVIFEDCDVALKKYPELFKKYFMKCVPYTDHKFAALHGAVWSGGTFLYVPKGVKLDMPLQAYFRMNAPSQGQFEHTLIIVEDDAVAHYIEGCFVAGTKISTLEGKKNIEDIQINDLVLTHQGGFQSVYDLQNYDYSGELFEIGYYGNSVETLECTEEHPILVVKRELANERNKNWNVEWFPANKIEKGDYLAVPINKVVLEDKVHKFKIKKYDSKTRSFYETEVEVAASKEFYKIVGYYLAEGSISAGSYLNFSFNINELNLVQEVEDLIFKVFGKEARRAYHHKNNGVNVVVSSVEICRIFEHFGRSSDKKSLPVFMQLARLDLQAEIIKAVFKGDGNYYFKTHKSGLKESFRISSTSYDLAFQLQQILFRLGVFAFINKSNRKKPRKPMYTVGITGEYLSNFGEIVGIPVERSLNSKKRATKFNLNSDFAFVPVKSIQARKVINRKVYNFSVKDAETYVASGVSVHNCSAPKYGTNALHAGCVEIYVGKRAKARYSSVENWSKDTYNLNTKRSIVDEDAVMEWVGGNMGSGVTMLYPSSILKGRGAHADHLGVAFANAGQIQDTGAKIVHAAPDTSCNVVMKSLSKGGGVAMYRGLLQVNPNAYNVTARVECDALILDDISRSDTVPDMKILNNDVTIAHEASAGKLNEEDIFYLTSRGIDEEAAKAMIVNGFIEPIVRELPLEYAVELNRLIEMEMEGSVG
jgi:Fe-S cluster assembly protein SufB